jgi:hypothetical protein
MAVNRRLALFLQRRDNDYQQLLHDDCLATAGNHALSVKVFYDAWDGSCSANGANTSARSGVGSMRFPPSA